MKRKFTYFFNKKDNKLYGKGKVYQNHSIVCYLSYQKAQSIIAFYYKLLGIDEINNDWIVKVEFS